MRTRILLGLLPIVASGQELSSQEFASYLAPLSPPPQVSLSLPPVGETWRLQSALISPQDESNQSFATLTEALGAASFDVRADASKRLGAAGPRARPFLREALHSPDPEIRLRAQEILAEIPKPPSSFEVRSWFTSTEGAGPPLHLLLNLLETIEDEGLRPTVHAWIVRHYPTEALPKTLHTTRSGRILAAFVAGFQAADTSSQTRDISEEATLCSLHYILGAQLAPNTNSAQPKGWRDSVPLLAGLPLSAAWHFEELLLQQSPGVSLAAPIGHGSQAERARAIAFWKEETSQQTTVSLDKENKENKKSDALWICEYDGERGGRVYRLGADNKPIDPIGQLQGPNDIQVLPGNRLLIAERNAMLITERDFKGKVFWQWQAPAAPIHCQRLEGGLTFYATFNEVGIVDPAGKIDWSTKVADGLRYARVTPEFEVQILTSRGTTMRLDPLGRKNKVVSERVGSSGSGYWGHLLPHADGSMFACFAGTHLVVQMNAEGKVVRQASVQSPVHIKELPGGRLLVCSFDQKCLIELDASLTETKRIPLEGRPFALASE